MTTTTKCACEVLGPCEVHHELSMCPLHAAAEELAKALEAAIKYITWPSYSAKPQVITSIQAALAKAGRS